MDRFSLEERLPEQEKPVMLTLTDDKAARTVALGFVDAFLIPAEATSSVVAWMPLPAPYLDQHRSCSGFLFPFSAHKAQVVKQHGDPCQVQV